MCNFLCILRVLSDTMATDTATQKFMELIRAHKPLISKVCLMYARDSEHFKDLYQEVMVNLWQGMESFAGQSKLSTWIYRVSLNTCVSFHRRHGKADAGVSLDSIADITDCSQEHAYLLRQMYALISQLDAMDKAIILMWLDSRPYEEIAEVTGLTRANVASRIHRIRQRLIKKSNE